MKQKYIRQIRSRQNRGGCRTEHPMTDLRGLSVLHMFLALFVKNVAYLTLKLTLKMTLFLVLFS